MLGLFLLPLALRMGLAVVAALVVAEGVAGRWEVELEWQDHAVFVQALTDPSPMAHTGLLHRAEDRLGQIAPHAR
jgi:hypothetical protein